MSNTRAALYMVAAAATACSAPGPSTGQTAQHSGSVSGAGYTTFDQVVLGCLDGASPNGVDCNNYAAKEDVYESGGPSAGGLGNGDYFFAVLAPGAQHDAAITDGAPGNLSQDARSNRTFTVTDKEISSYDGTHPTGTSPDPYDKHIIQLMPYADTPNAGGVYILAICAVTATSARDCKFDAFRIRGGDTTGPDCGVPQPPPWIGGGKYYDLNANGQWDPGEVGIASWPINYNDATVTTGGDGLFKLDPLADDGYHVAEQQATNTTTLQNGTIVTTWQQTGNTVDQTVVTGDASEVLNADMTYDIVVVDGSSVDHVYFGNLCLGAGGGLTLGFWSNKNGQALITAADLAFLSSLNLRTVSGADFDPGNNAGLRTWLLNATATNMAYMLSAQLAAMELNVRHGFVHGTTLVYTSLGYMTVDALMAAANTSLGTDPNTTAAGAARTYQEQLKNALDDANNNKNFVEPDAAHCPAPTF